MMNGGGVISAAIAVLVMAFTAVHHGSQNMITAGFKSGGVYDCEFGDTGRVLELPGRLSLLTPRYHRSHRCSLVRVMAMFPMVACIGERRRPKKFPNSDNSATEYLERH
jgi:hypothetical protein